LHNDRPSRLPTLTAAVDRTFDDAIFRRLVEDVPDYAIFLIDPDGYVRTWNTGAARLKGYAADEIIGRHFSVFYPQDAIDRGWPAHELHDGTRDRPLRGRRLALAQGRHAFLGKRGAHPHPR
jgi:PAS domain S-box-containing protein